MTDELTCCALSPAARRVHLLRKPSPGEPRAARCRPIRGPLAAAAGGEAYPEEGPLLPVHAKAAPSTTDIALAKLLKFAPLSRPPPRFGATAAELSAWRQGAAELLAIITEAVRQPH